MKQASAPQRRVWRGTEVDAEDPIWPAVTRAVLAGERVWIRKVGRRGILAAKRLAESLDRLGHVEVRGRVMHSGPEDATVVPFAFGSDAIRPRVARPGCRAFG